MLHIESFLETEEDSDAVAAKKAERTETETIETGEPSEEVEAQGIVSLSTIVETISSESKKSEKKQPLVDSKLPPEFTRGYEARAAMKTKMSDETKELIQQHIADAQSAFPIRESDDAIGISASNEGIADDVASYGNETEHFSETDMAYESAGAISSASFSAQNATENSAKKYSEQSFEEVAEKSSEKKTEKSATNTSSAAANAKTQKLTVSRKKTPANAQITPQTEEVLSSSPSFFEERELMELPEHHGTSTLASDSTYAYGSYPASERQFSETEFSDADLSETISDLETDASTDVYASQNDAAYADAREEAPDIANIDTSFEVSDIADIDSAESAYNASRPQIEPASHPSFSDQKEEVPKNSSKEETPILSSDDLYDISAAFDISSVSVDDAHLSELISQSEDQAEEETPAFDYLYSEESSLTQDNLDDIDRAYEISTASLAAQRFSRKSRYIETDDNDIVQRGTPSYSKLKTSEQSVNKQCDEIEQSLSSLEEKIRAMVSSENDSLARPIRRLRTVAAAREAKQKTVKALNSVEKKRKLPAPNEAVWNTLTRRQRTALIIIINSMERCFHATAAYANFANDDAYALYRVLRSALSR